MRGSRLLIVGLLLLAPAPAVAQLLGADQDARVKAISSQLSREVERCSLAANGNNRTGPAKLQLELDERGNLRRLTVLDDWRKADIGKCIGAFKLAEPLPSARFSGGKTIRLEFAFHAWAGRSKRSWTEVRKHLKDSKVEAALSKCIVDAGKGRPKEVDFSMDISPAGQVTVAVDESPIGACFAAATGALTFGQSENHYRVEYRWTTSSKPRVARGFVTEPDECEVDDYACSWAETTAARVNLGNEYVRQLGERIDCSNPAPALAWLEKQPHVRWVRAAGCDVSLLVDGSRPMTYFAP